MKTFNAFILSKIKSLEYLSNWPIKECLPGRGWNWNGIDKLRVKRQLVAVVITGIMQKGWFSRSRCLSHMKSLYRRRTMYSFSTNSIRATFVVMRNVIKVSKVSKCFCGLSIFTHRSEFSSMFNSDKFSTSCIVEKLSKLGDWTCGKVYGSMLKGIIWVYLPKNYHRNHYKYSIDHCCLLQQMRYLSFQ